MALLFCDSFDHYSALANKYNGFLVPTGSGAISAANGRNGTSSFRITNWSVGITKSIAATGTVVVGFALRVAALPTVAVVVARVLEGATAHVDLRMDTAGRLFFTRAGTTIGLVGTTALAAGSWYYLEAKITISDTVGVASLRINGVSELNGAGLDTRNAGTSGVVDVVGLAGVTGLTATVDFDDLYICNAAGTVNNDFLGDIRVEAIFPTAEATYSAWLPSVGTDNALNVDESPPNSDTDYNSSATALDKDTFAMTNITPTSGTIKGVQPCLFARKDDAGTRVIAPMSRQGATDYVSATTHSIGDAYAYHTQIMELNPATGLPWTIADVNTNSEFGYRLES